MGKSKFFRIRLSHRLALPLVVGIAAVALVFAYSQVRAQQRELRQDLERRAAILAETLSESVEPLLAQKSPRELQRLVERMSAREGLAGIVVYESGEAQAITPRLPALFRVPPNAADLAMRQDTGYGEFLTLGDTLLHVYSVPIHRDNAVVGALAVFHSADYLATQGWTLWRGTFLRVLFETFLIAVVALLVIRWSIVGPMLKTAQWMKDLRLGRANGSPELPEEGFFTPLAREVRNFATSLAFARAQAQKEARLRHAAESQWTPERLRVHVHRKLQGRPLFVVANREPLMHVRRGKEVEALVPASGLVTALEPILRACNGTWVAHGSGEADRETVDSRDHVRVPPEDPCYTLRRVWLGREEEDGYYYGFANEGLWPLCHIAYTRPIFRADDWAQYQAVNRKFADAVVEEIQGIDEPAVLVQDYHFALLPRLVKEKRPDARVAIFWHIPWPNSEAFGICPWQTEVLDGLLGADVIGFHVQAHCLNFLETVDRALESRIEWERLAVNRSGHFTLVRSFPISVSFEDRRAEAAPADRGELFKQLGVRATFMGLGVDRVDYTKGILERFRAVERFLEKNPQYLEQFTFVQIGAPSREHIRRYQELLKEVQAEADRINEKMARPPWKPIVLLTRHHSHQEIEPFYRAADFCAVTSLHDGMNLVAKEFVAARDDEGGALILSQFTGASRELRDALVVNPYDIENVAEAMRLALEAEPEELRLKMRRMRQTVRENNVYRWAASLITDLSEVRLDAESSPRPALAYTGK